MSMRVAIKLGGNESAGGGQGASMRADGGQAMNYGGNAGMYMPAPMPRSYGPHYEGESFEGRAYGGEQARQMGFTAPLDEPEARRRSRRTGRFVRGEMDDEPVARSGGRRSEYDGETGSYERRDDTEHLERKIKRLEQRLDQVEEARDKLHQKLREVESGLEEGKRSKGREKRERGEKERGRDDDGDDEGDPVGTLRRLLRELPAARDFLKELPGVFEGLLGVLVSPPPTWPPYLAKGDYAGIFEMEGKELLQALAQFKEGKKDAAAVCRELKHSGAALVQLYAHLAQSLPDDARK